MPYLIEEEIAYLIEQRNLPSAYDVSLQRFINPYENISQILTTLDPIVLFPISNAIQVIKYSLQAIWAVLRAVGNLLILKPNFALDAIYDVAIDSTLAIALAVMAPIHALSHSLELLTRMVTSWFIGSESTDDLSTQTFNENFLREWDKMGTFYPSSKYLYPAASFFSPHENVGSFLNSLAAPPIMILSNGLISLGLALGAVGATIKCLSNLLICKPKHALECLSELGILTSLTIGMTAMLPINGIIASINAITRLGATWETACADNSTPEAGVELAIRPSINN
jgi:hypothetical protein